MRSEMKISSSCLTLRVMANTSHFLVVSDSDSPASSFDVYCVYLFTNRGLSVISGMFCSGLYSLLAYTV